jgi:arylsulfatase A-like enzyme
MMGATLTILGFGILAGLLGESVEVVRLVAGGMSPPEMRLRWALFLGYGGFGALCCLVSLLIGKRRAFAAAMAAFGMLLVLPWLNFDYLPKWSSWQTVVGSVIAGLALVVSSFWLARHRRALAVATVGVAILANIATATEWGSATPSEADAGGTRSRTNVVLILVDTLRADHLGTYGYSRPTSPNIDALSRQSVTFDHAMAQATWTKPSVASLFTSAFVHRHGVIASRDALGPELPTLAEQMRKQGYRTVAFTANPWITPEFHFDRGFDRFESERAMGVQLTNLYRVLSRGDRLFRRLGMRLSVANLVFWDPGKESPTNSRRDEQLADSAMKWLETSAQSPFFLYVHLIGPHDPYDPPPEYARRFRGDAVTGPPLTRPPARVQSIFEEAQPLDPARLANLKAQYDGALAFSDTLVGRILATLDRLHLSEHSLVVLTADHGEEFYEHHNWRHGNQLYNEVLHVPLMMRMPGKLVPARRSDAAMVIDIFPSIFGLLDLPLGVQVDGRNLFAGTATGPQAVYSEHFRREGGDYASRMVYRNGLKLVETRDANHGEERSELFDLRTDPYEHSNLFSSVEPVSTKESAAQLHLLLVALGKEVPKSAAPAIKIDGSTKERLRALGY